MDIYKSLTSEQLHNLVYIGALSLRWLTDFGAHMTLWSLFVIYIPMNILSGVQKVLLKKAAIVLTLVLSCLFVIGVAVAS